jgi:hypothetical protein
MYLRIFTIFTDSEYEKQRRNIVEDIEYKNYL